MPNYCEILAKIFFKHFSGINFAVRLIARFSVYSLYSFAIFCMLYSAFQAGSNDILTTCVAQKLAELYKFFQRLFRLSASKI